jgi:outer membrane protein OmpA-like peptidoglycan-associated protein
MGGVYHDVWFRFVTVAPDVTITVMGNTRFAPGGTLSRPEVSLYAGSCKGTITELQCESDNAGKGIVELYKGGLTVGQTYYIRIDGRNNSKGSFKLCTTNYNPPVNPGSDCVSRAFLCDKSPFVVQSIVGAGKDPDELSDSCLGNNLDANSESNSTWFAWTAGSTGSLTFALTPTNPTDDLDFVVYELPNGINNCKGKIVMRCMAAGDFNYPSPCMGPTGLREGAHDKRENPGCGPGKDGWLSPLEMVEGKSYALVVNNFTSTGNGFSIAWGGTGMFQGPVADFMTDDADNVIGLGHQISFTDASSSHFSNIVDYAWNFGVDALPATANGNEAHIVKYDSPGTKSVVLTVKNDLGCVVTRIMDVEVEDSKEEEVNNPSMYEDEDNSTVAETNDSPLVEKNPTYRDTSLILTENIFFDFAKDHIRGSEFSKIDKLAEALPKGFKGFVRLSAHTDSIGTNGNNYALSERRANSVIQYLVGKRVAAVPFISRYQGETVPVADNGSDTGRQQNRRVEVAIYQVSGTDLAEADNKPAPTKESTPKPTPTPTPEPEPVVPESGIMILVVEKGEQKPLQAEVVYQEYSSDPNQSIQTNEYGKGTIDLGESHVKQRTFTLSVYTPGYFYFTDEVKVPAGEVKKVKVELQAIKVGTTIALNNFYFYGNQAKLRPRSVPELARLKKSLEMNPGVRIEIGGHINYPFTRPQDVPTWSRELSVRRAKMVYDYLVKNGIPAEDLEYKGYSNTKMVYPRAQSMEHQAANMRVELRVIE